MASGELEERLLSRTCFNEFVVPSYDGYCLSSVPSTILSMFGVERGRPKIPSDVLEVKPGTQNVVLLLADGLGYYDAKPLVDQGDVLGAAARAGAFVPITTVFPSTTAAALTTVATGLTPQEHCLPEWFVYMKEVDKVVATLPFSAVGQRGRDGMAKEMDPRALFSGPTVNWALRRMGVDVACFVGAGIARTAYSKLSHAGSEVVPYMTSSDLFAALRRRIEAARRPSFFYVYWEKVDTIGHSFGPGTEESASEASLLNHLVRRELLDRLSPGAAQETTLILTADHGQVRVDPRGATFVNGMRSVLRDLRRSPAGKMIPPWGSARDMYLAARDGRAGALEASLRRGLGDEAVVLPTSEAVEAGYFGLGRPRDLFLDRVGDVMVLPRKNNLVWYRYARGERLGVKGHHGGMSPREMLVPLVVSRVSELL
ncbi:MAG: alkaline phosphatase family protein [Nitrososphaerota archaeon]|nr:alkaline phosphatase family protein [Nitrososphaerota archaeon]MDG6977784.1 alkaline phosphatase family protein [Nitrososphaerota archaeon]